MAVELPLSSVTDFCKSTAPFHVTRPVSASSVIRPELPLRTTMLLAIVRLGMKRAVTAVEPLVAPIVSAPLPSAFECSTRRMSARISVPPLWLDGPSSSSWPPPVLMSLRGVPSSVIEITRAVEVLFSVRSPARSKPVMRLVAWVPLVTVSVVLPETSMTGAVSNGEPEVTRAKFSAVVPLTVSEGMAMVASALLRRSSRPPCITTGLVARMVGPLEIRVPPFKVTVPVSAASAFSVSVPEFKVVAPVPNAPAAVSVALLPLMVVPPP